MLKRYKRYFEDEIIDQTKTPKFKKWFGKSKVVKNGKPLIVYHGSTVGFNIFDSKKIGSHTDDGMWGKGFYFSDERTAKKYGANVVGVFLSIKNPYMITGKQTIQEVADYLEIDESILKSDNGFVRPYVPYIGTFTSNIKYKGHDGIIVDRGGISNEFVVFNANQIKSAIENNGEFNKSSNNIYESEFKEDVSIPLNKNDEFYYGKFKNKRAIFDHSYINEKGDLIFVTSTGKEISACKVRLIKESEELDENVTLSDLKKNIGASDFTKDWLEIRRKLVGPGNKSSKIKSMKINRKQGYVTFVFESVPSYFDKKVQVVDPSSLTLSKKAKKYREEIRFLKFFEWAQTKPGYKENELTNKEVREIFNVCDIQYFCSCGSFQFQGMNALSTILDGSIYPETRMPTRWADFHHGNSLTCKHLSMIFNSMGLFLTNMTSMINKYLKSKNK